jgi:hypothetical protein
MMTQLPLPLQRMRALFSRQRCWMIDDISNQLGYAVISIRRFLKQIGYFRSFTHNGKWYTLRSIPAFNKDGIWIYEDIGFSKHGNLTQTITHIINRSPQGCTAKELAGKLHYSCYAVLTNMYKGKMIDRVKLTGEFSYISIDDKINLRQLERLKMAKTPQPISAETAVFVLVEFIKDPQLSFKDISARLKRNRNITVSPKDIDQFFQKHGIKKNPIHRH